MSVSPQHHSGETIIVTRPDKENLFERFKYGENYTSREVDIYVDSIVEQLRNARSDKEVEEVIATSVPADNLEMPPQDKKDAVLQTVIPDFTDKDFDNLMQDVEIREIQERIHMMEEEDTGEILAVSYDDDLEPRTKREQAEEARKEAREAFLLLRQRIINKLEERMLNENSLEGWQKKHIFFLEKFLGNEHKGHIRLVKSLDGKKEVVREDRILAISKDVTPLAQYSESEKKTYIESVQDCVKLERSPYLTSITNFDPQHGRMTVEYKKFKSLTEIISEDQKKEKKDRKPVSKYVSFIRDALRGAEHIKKAGVGVQDIALHNISIFEGDEGMPEHGGLADLEGVYRLNTELSTRLGATSDIKTDASVDQTAATGQSAPESPYHPPELTKTKSFPGTKLFTEYEMVFQFGTSLRIMNECLGIAASMSNKKLRKAWLDVERQMTAFDEHAENYKDSIRNRISLEAAEQKLTELVALLESESM